MTRILLCSSAVRVHDSQAYRKMGVTRKRICRILEMRDYAPVVPNWFQPCQCCCRLCYPGEYLRLGRLVGYNSAQVLEACNCFKFLSVYFDLLVDADGVVCHQLGLHDTDLHAVGCGGFVEKLN